MVDTIRRSQKSKGESKDSPFFFWAPHSLAPCQTGSLPLAGLAFRTQLHRTLECSHSDRVERMGNQPSSLLNGPDVD